MPLPSFALTGNLNDILPTVVSGQIGTSAWDRVRIILSDNLDDGVLVWQGKVYNRPPTQILQVDTNGDISSVAHPVLLLANAAGLNVTGIQWHVRIEAPRGTLVTEFWFDAPSSGATVDLATVVPAPGVSAVSLPIPPYVPYANLAAFPVRGGSIFYLALDTGLLYRWSGSGYVAVGGSGGGGTPSDGSVTAAKFNAATLVTAAETIAANSNDTTIPTSAAVQGAITAAVSALLNGAPGALDTLKELADAINDDASFAATVTTALASKARKFVPTAVKTGAYTAAAFDIVVVDASAGVVPIALSGTPADGDVVLVKKIDGTTTAPGFAVSITCGGSSVFNKAGGSTTLTLTLPNHAVGLQYKASGGIWYVIWSDVPLSQTDARYLKTAFDVIVVGATEVGVMSALAAARQGLSVLMVGQNERIGGNVGYGVTRQDLIPYVSPQQVTGITREVLSKMAYQASGPREFGSWWRSGGPTKPTWVKRTFAEALGAERNITTVLSKTLDAVTKSGTTITSVTISGQVYTGTAIIDATPTNDVAQKAGCTTSTGREGNALYTETNAGVLVTATSTVDPYVTPGVSASGVIPGVSTRALGTTGAADPGVMTFGWRLFITTVAGEKIAWPTTAPAGYSALKYELLARSWAANAAYYNATDGSYTSAVWKAFSRLFQYYPIDGSGDAIDTQPTRGDLNSLGYLSSNYPNAEECLEYITATPTRRAQIELNASQYLKGLFYFITQSTDSRIPANLKTAVNTIGLSNVELPEYGGWNPNFYVREGARLVGDFVMKESDISVSNGVSDIIGWWCYDFDAHPVRYVLDAGAVKSEGTVTGAAAQNQLGSPVSMKVLFPKVTECTNLLCPGQPSVSRRVYTGLRATLSMMVLGEGAGYVAADAVRNKSTVQTVSASRVKAMQNLAGFWNAYGVANSSGDFTMGHGATLSEGGAGAAFANITSGLRFGQHLAIPCNVQAVAAGVDRYKRFVPTITKAGRYRVVHIYPTTKVTDTAGIARASNVGVSIVHADGTATRVENQGWSPSTGGGSGFDVLGDFYFPYNTTGLISGGGYVDINTNGASSNGLVVAGIIVLFELDDVSKSLNA